MITILLVMIAGVFKAIMDVLQFHYRNSIFSNWNTNWWNPAISYKNKYKKGTLKPKFFGSTTFLVWITDA